MGDSTESVSSTRDDHRHAGSIHRERSGGAGRHFSRRVALELQRHSSRHLPAQGRTPRSLCPYRGGLAVDPTVRRRHWASRCALHGVTWIDDSAPIELIAKHGRRRPGVVIREERIGEDEVVHAGNLPVASPARTALDLGRHFERDSAVAHIDALAAVSGLAGDAVRFLEDRYESARGIRAARTATGLMDGGASSQQQSHLRLRLIDAGLPRPRTNIVVGDDLWEAVIAMGWDEPKVGVDCFYPEDTDRYRAVQQIATEEYFSDADGCISASRQTTLQSPLSGVYVPHCLSAACANRAYSTEASEVDSAGTRRSPAWAAGRCFRASRATRRARMRACRLVIVRFFAASRSSCCQLSPSRSPSESWVAITTHPRRSGTVRAVKFVVAMSSSVAIVFVWRWHVCGAAENQ